MARIRTLKPEAMLHRKVGRLSDRAFRLWVAMLTQADDHGRLIFDPDQFRVLVWGYHARVRPADVVQGLEEVVSTGLVRGYAVDNGGQPVDNGGQPDSPLYLEFHSWHDHQKVSHPAKSRLPAWTAAGAEAFSRALVRIREAARGLQNLPRGSIYRSIDLSRQSRVDNSGAQMPGRTRVQDRSSGERDSTGDEGDPRGQRPARHETAHHGPNHGHRPLAPVVAGLLASLATRSERGLQNVPQEHVEL